jgi:hypothetical protein
MQAEPYALQKSGERLMSYFIVRVDPDDIDTRRNYLAVERLPGSYSTRQEAQNQANDLSKGKLEADRRMRQLMGSQGPYRETLFVVWNDEALAGARERGIVVRQGTTRGSGFGADRTQPRQVKLHLMGEFDMIMSEVKFYVGRRSVSGI